MTQQQVTVVGKNSERLIKVTLKYKTEWNIGVYVKKYNGQMRQKLQQGRPWK